MNAVNPIRFQVIFYSKAKKRIIMSELSVQEKLLKLQQMGKLPYDNIPTLGEYLQLAMELADCKTKFKAAIKILDEIIANCQYRNDVTTCEVCCDMKCCEEYALHEALQ
jgi:hypothetical protein